MRAKGAGMEAVVVPVEMGKPIASESHKASTWFRSLSHEKRAAIRALHEVRPVWNGVIVVFLAMWAGSAWLVLSAPTWPVQCVGYLLIGIALHALGVVLHEGIHGSLTRNRFVDRWIGFALGIPLLISYSAYRVTHLTHHRWNRTEHDPDEITNFSRSRTLLSMAFYAWMVLGTPYYFTVYMPWTAYQRALPRERRIIVVEYLGLAAIIGAVILVSWQAESLSVLAHVWAIPFLAAQFIGNIRGWSEHMLTVPGHPLTQTRTVTSNRLVSFLALNLNYHLEHHLFPGIPWYNLPKLHRLLQDDYRQAGVFVYRSYVRFLIDAFIIGVHGVAPKVQGSPRSQMSTA